MLHAHHLFCVLYIAVCLCPISLSVLYAARCTRTTCAAPLPAHIPCGQTAGLLDLLDNFHASCSEVFTDIRSRMSDRYGTDTAPSMSAQRPPRTPPPKTPTGRPRTPQYLAAVEGVSGGQAVTVVAGASGAQAVSQKPASRERPRTPSGEKPSTPSKSSQGTVLSELSKGTVVLSKC